MRRWLLHREVWSYATTVTGPSLKPGTTIEVMPILDASAAVEQVARVLATNLAMPDEDPRSYEDIARLALAALEEQ